MAAANVEKLINLALLEIFGRATIVPLVGTVSDLSLSLQALSDEVEALEPGSMDGTFGKRLEACEQNVLALTIGLALETGAVASGTSDNIVVETFADTSGYIIISGSYDSTNHRIMA